MSKEKYFDGESGVYYDPNQGFEDLVYLKEVEPIKLVNTKTNKTRIIKRYDIRTASYNYKKTALTWTDSLVYLGEL